ncbi:MAG: fibronectin type III domain-containing protein [Lysinibacillus sp.]
MQVLIKKIVGLLVVIMLIVNSVFIPQSKAEVKEQEIHTYSQNTWAWNTLATGPKGEIYLTHKVSNTEIAIKKWNGSKWDYLTSVTTSITGDTSFSDDLDLVVDKSGKLHLVFKHDKVYDTTINSHRGIKYGVFDGVNWTFSIIEESSDSRGWKNYDDPSIAVDSKGKVHIVYKYTDSNEPRLYAAKYATNVTGVWNASTLVVGNGTIGIDEIHDPQIEIDASDVVHVTYVREDNQNDYYGNYYYTSKAAAATSFPTAQKLIDAVADKKQYRYFPFVIDETGKISIPFNALIERQVDGIWEVETTSFVYSKISGAWIKEEVLHDGQRETYPIGISTVGSKEYLLMKSVAADWSDYHFFAMVNDGSGWVRGNKTVLPTLPKDQQLDETTFTVDDKGNFLLVMLHNNLKTISSLTGTSEDFGLITVPKSTDANLSKLVLSSGTLSPGFSSSTVSYTANVANNVSSINITPTLADSKATVKVNGVSVANGQASSNITLNVGSNTIFVVVNAEDGTTIKLYTITVTRGAPTVPGTPVIGSATAGEGQAIVDFTAPTSDGGSPVTGYKVKVYKGGIEQASLNTTGKTSPITVTGLTNGTAYTFKVVATNAVGDSAESAASNAVTPVTKPDAPTNVIATAGDSQAIVNFTAPTNNGGSAITGYTVTASPGGVTETGTTGPITVTGLTNDTAYTFTVKATNVVGTSGASAASNSVTPSAVPPTVPEFPTNVSVTAGEGQATVNFTAPTSDGGSPVTGYKVKVYKGGIEQASLNTTGKTSPITVTGLTNGTAYTFKVVATNAVGDSAESAASNEVTPVTKPDAPTNVSATAGDNQATVNFTAPTSNGGSAITGYEVKVYKGGVEQTALNTTGTTSPITVTGLTNGTAYTFKVVAINAVGSSIESTDTTPITPLANQLAPTGLTGVAPTTSAGNDGKIVGTTNLMEYKLIADSKWTSVTGSEISNLSAGTYQVRYAAKHGYNAGLIVNITVPKYASSGGGGGGGSYPPPTSNSEEIEVDVDAGDGSNLMQTSITRTTGLDGTVKDNIRLQDNVVKETVRQLKERGMDTARIVIPDTKDKVAETYVEIPKASLEELKKGEINLEIVTANGVISISKTSLKNFTGDLYFRVVPIKTEEKRQEIENRAKEEALIQQVTNGQAVQVVGRPMQIETNLQGKEVTLFFPLKDSLPTDPVERQKILENLGVFIEHSDGTKELIQGKVIVSNGVEGLEFKVTKFSTFTMLYMDGWKEYLASKEPLSHSPYIKGYEDDTFRPNAFVTRSQMAAMLSRNLPSDSSPSTIEDYIDVAKNHRTYEDIMKVKRAGIMMGDLNNQFKPAGSITRSQMATIAYRWIKQSCESDSKAFDSCAALDNPSDKVYTDVAANHHALEAIMFMKSASIMTGYEDNTFKPEKKLTRAQAVKVLNRLFKRGPLNVENHSTFKDVQKTHWAFYEIEEAAREHQYTIDADGKETVSK